MTSPTAKPKESQPAAQSPQINPEVLVLARQKHLLAKTVWWLLQNHNAIEQGVFIPSATINEDEIPDLWNLKTEEDADGNLKITADLLPDLTDEQITQIAGFLLGTKEPILAVIEKFKLPQGPAHIEAAVRPWVVRYEGVWVVPSSLNPPATAAE